MKPDEVRHEGPHVMEDLHDLRFLVLEDLGSHGVSAQEDLHERPSEGPGDGARGVVRKLGPVDVGVQRGDLLEPGKGEGAQGEISFRNHELELSAELGQAVTRLIRVLELGERLVAGNRDVLDGLLVVVGVFTEETFSDQHPHDALEEALIALERGLEPGDLSSLEPTAPLLQRLGELLQKLCRSFHRRELYGKVRAEATEH